MEFHHYHEERVIHYRLPVVRPRPPKVRRAADGVGARDGGEMMATRRGRNGERRPEIYRPSRRGQRQVQALAGRAVTWRAVVRM